MMPIPIHKRLLDFFGLAIRSIFFLFNNGLPEGGRKVKFHERTPVHEMAGLFSNMNGYCYFILGILVLAAGY